MPVSGRVRVAVDLTGPAPFIAPALAAVFVRGQVLELHQVACREACARLTHAGDVSPGKPAMADAAVRLRGAIMAKV
ncbi:hypothetical protein GCM10027266_12840 [Arenimonas alkanexedens]